MFTRAKIGSNAPVPTGNTGGTPTSTNNNNNNNNNNNLIVTVFQSSLDNLLLESTRHRTMTPLRDAVQSARIKGLTAEDLFHTFVLACDTLHNRRNYRLLLLQSLSDLGKMASLGVIPISGSVIHVICHLVRKLLGSNNNNNSTIGGSGGISFNNSVSNPILLSSLWGSTQNQSKLVGVGGTASSGIDSLSGSVSLEGPLILDSESREGSISAGNDNSEIILIDEEIQMRILQTLMAYLSACALDNPALSDIMGILYTIYIQANPGSMVEATCGATIEQRTLALLNNFRNSTGDADHIHDNKTSFSTQIHSVAYLKDICSICSGVAPKWLKIGSQKNSSISSVMSSSTYQVIMTGPPPRRLRILLLRTLITHFADSEPITSPQQLNFFFIQCLNEDIISLVLRRTRSPGVTHHYQNQQQEQQETGSLINFVPFSNENQDDEEFYLTQKLGVTVMSKALPVMQHTMSTLLRHHVMFLKLSGESEDGGEDVRRMSIILALWKKAIADHQVLRQLLLIPSSSSSSSSSPSILSNNNNNNSNSSTKLNREEQQQEEEFSQDDIDAAHPFIDLVTSAAQLLASIIAASEGILDLDHINEIKEGFSPLRLSITSSPSTIPSAAVGGVSEDGGEGIRDDSEIVGNITERHPATTEAGDVLAFLTMFTQSFARIVEALLQEKSSARKVATMLFISLHSSLLRCFALSAQHLQGDDVIHTILKGTTHLVQVCCNLDLSTQRDGYLQIFLSRLHMQTPLLPQQQQQQQEEEEIIKKRNISEERTSTTRGKSFLIGVKETPNSIHSSISSPSSTLLRRSLDVIQQKLYVLKCVISVASSMGSVLGDGWGPVASCLLLVEPLLQSFQNIIEQQQQQQQKRKTKQKGQDIIEEITLEDVIQNADHVRDALHLLFINSALSSDYSILEALLKHFVTEVCSHSSYICCISSLRMISECCALALVTAAGRINVSLEWLLRLWSAVKPLYLFLFAPANITIFVKSSMMNLETPVPDRLTEALSETMERIIEDIAVVMAQFCECVNNNNNNTSNSNSITRKSIKKGDGEVEEVKPLLLMRLTSGPYSMSSLVLRLTHLIPSLISSTPSRSWRGISSVNSPSYNDEKIIIINEEELLKRQLLASPAELLATIYENMLQQQYHSSIRNNNNNNNNVGIEVVQAITRGVSLVLLKEILKLVQGFGEELRGAAWEHFLQLLRCAAISPTPPQTPVIIVDTGTTSNSINSPSNSPTNISTVSNALIIAGVKQSISVAFRALETIQHSSITSLNDEGLRQLIRCGGAFMIHNLPGPEQRLNINLSAVQLLWSIADYIVSREIIHHESEEETSKTIKEREEKFIDKNDDLLWCTLLMQLYDGCLDIRPEVRQSALKTLFSLVQTYGGKLSSECWRCVLRGVLIPLIDITMEATYMCAIPTPILKEMKGNKSFGNVNSQLTLLQSPRTRRSRRESLFSPHLKSSSPSSPSLFTNVVNDKMSLWQNNNNNNNNNNNKGEEERRVAELLRHLKEHPGFLDDMRITIMDAVCRVFVGHYEVMHYTLIIISQQQKQEQQIVQTEGEILLHKTLSLFIEFCSLARFVAKTTSGEAAALSSVRALHALMGANNTNLLTQEELKFAWSAVELLFRREEDCVHTSKSQCTAAVVSTIVASLGNIVALRLAANKENNNNNNNNYSMGNTTTTAAAATTTTTLSSSFFFDHFRNSFTSSPIVNTSTEEKEKVTTTPTYQDYFLEFITLTKDSLHSFSVTDSYFFPGRVQMAVISAFKILWPLTNLNQRQAILNIIIEQFPTRHIIQTFVTQNLNISSEGKKFEKEEVISSKTLLKQTQGQEKQKRLISLYESLPPGAHPSFLMALMDFFHFIADDNNIDKEKQNQEEEEEEEEEQQYEQKEEDSIQLKIQEELIFYSAPKIVHITGILLLLEYAPPEVLATPGPGLVFNIPSDFFDKTERCLQLFLANVISSITSNNRREALLELATSFANTFTSLVSLANTMLNPTIIELRSQIAQISQIESTNYLQPPLQRLERLVLLIGELIPHVIRNTGDVGVATELLSVLVPSSSVDSPLFAGVAKRSLDVLRRWSISATNKTDSSELVSTSASDNNNTSESNVMEQESNEKIITTKTTTKSKESERIRKNLKVLESNTGKVLFSNLEREELSSKLQSVARASMGARNRAVLRRFLLNTNSIEARQMAKTTLQTIVLLYPIPLDKSKAQKQQKTHNTLHEDDENLIDSEGTEILQCILQELARLVEHTGDDMEFRSLLSRAMLGICTALGFPQSE